MRTIRIQIGKKYWDLENLGKVRKSLLSFSTAQTKKISWEKIGENKIGCLVVWCHEQDKYVAPVHCE